MRWRPRRSSSGPALPATSPSSGRWATPPPSTPRSPRPRHVVSLELINNRVIPCPLEPRAVVGVYDPGEDRYTLYAGSQGAHAIRDLLARATLKVPEDRLRVVVGDVGGGFGTKIFHYPEDALALWAARRLGRPVKWKGDRSEAFLADTHGRDQLNAVTAGFDRDGRCWRCKCAPSPTWART